MLSDIFLFSDNVLPTLSGFKIVQTAQLFSKELYLVFRSNTSRSEDITRLSKDHMRQCIKLDKELHELRLKHEIARHKAELEVLKLQLDYWNGKLKNEKKD